MPEEPWLKICHRLPEDPAVIGIAERTGLDQATVVGQLVRVWIWADQNLVDGNAPSVTEKWLDGYTGCAGFASAMESEQWLVIKADGLVFPKFEKHMGSSAKKRLSTSVRVAQHRKRKCNAESVTCSPSLSISQKGRGVGKGARDFWQEAVDAMKGPSLATDRFRAAWGEWIGHLRERGKAPTRRAIVGQIRKCEDWGERRAIEAIGHSIAGNYQGLYEATGTKPDSPARAKAPPGKWAGL